MRKDVHYLMNHPVLPHLLHIGHTGNFDYMAANIRSHYADHMESSNDR
jgi:hypothetical protein